MEKPKPQRKNSDPSSNVRRITLMAMLFSSAVVLSLLESYIPIPQAPGVKLGLSNIIVMYSLFFMSKSDALLLVALKGGFAFVTRGLSAGVMSISGGFVSIVVMILLIHIFKNKISYLAISIAGALSHNIGQIIAASLLLDTVLFAFLPVLIISGIVTGIITSAMLRITLPAIKNANHKFK